MRHEIHLALFHQSVQGKLSSDFGFHLFSHAVLSAAVIHTRQKLEADNKFIQTLICIQKGKL